jgi:hypothetical protein
MWIKTEPPSAVTILNSAFSFISAIEEVHEVCDYAAAKGDQLQPGRSVAEAQRVGEGLKAVRLCGRMFG